jgi:sulfur carrier protein
VAAFLRDGSPVVKKSESGYGFVLVTAIINGERRAIAEGKTIADLLSELALAGRRVAVEVNRDIVPAAEYASRALTDGDTVEIVQFVGGG